MGQISETDYGFKLMNLRSKLCLLTSDNKKVKTFSIDDLLPSLPLPTLKQTINNYLKSIKPFVDKLEYLSMEKKLEDFRIGQGKVLQFHLRSKAKKEKNWLETWWLNWTYLESKNPLIPYSNGAGIFLDLNQDPYANLKLTLLNIQIAKAAAYVHFCNKFFEEVRNESLKVHKSRSNYLNMDQFRRFFNTCRVPGENKDQIVTHFKTVNEGQCPTHLIAIYKNRFFMMDAYHEDKKSLLNIGEIYNQLNHIVNNTSSFGIGIGALTADKRDSWAKNREYLIQLDPNNQKYFDLIEKAVYIVDLDQESPTEINEFLKLILLQNSKNRFYDKSYQMIVSSNGFFGSNIEHSPFDGMASTTVSTFVRDEMIKLNFDLLQINSIKASEKLEKPVELSFKYDLKVEIEINRCVDLFCKNSGSIEVKNLTLEAYNKEKLKSFKINPDTVTQMAMQLAYYQLHNKPAPTYETATTRAYYHGRTETVRSCSMEAVEWCREMCNKDPQSRLNNKQLLDLFKRACNKHDSLMIEARQNAGCDRHLLGLMLMSKELNFDIPDIFTNDVWKKSGGGGNFLISSSCVGYSENIGTCAPFCLNGYTMIYSFSNYGLTFGLARYKMSTETSLEKMSQSLLSAFNQIEGLFELTSKL